MNKYAGNSIALSFLIGMIIMIVAHFLSRPLLRLIDTPDEIIDMSAQYIDVLYYAVPIQMSLNNFNSLFFNPTGSGLADPTGFPRRGNLKEIRV